jgi:hypothetical protein
MGSGWVRKAMKVRGVWHVGQTKGKRSQKCIGGEDAVIAMAVDAGWRENLSPAVESEGRPSAIPNEAFEAGAVGSLDTDTGIEAEPPTVIPGEHILGLVAFQEAMALKRPQDPGTDGMLAEKPAPNAVPMTTVRLHVLAGVCQYGPRSDPRRKSRQRSSSTPALISKTGHSASVLRRGA